jgi:hypothetical protein
MSNSNNNDVINRQILRAEQELVRQRSLSSLDDDEGMAVLFTGNHHDAFPRYLVANRELSPVDKITWQVIRLTINDPARPGSTPRRDELAAAIGCSAPTLTLSRNMLRICRWMTLCKSVRHQGKFVGDIYLLNDEPLSLIATMDFDPGYVQFLEVQCESSNKRIRQAAALALSEIGALETFTPPGERDMFFTRLTREEINKQADDRTANNRTDTPNSASTTPYPHAESNQSGYGNRRKNLSPVEARQNQGNLRKSALGKHQRKNLSAEEINQRKNLSPVDKKISFPGEKNSFSGGSSGSSYINNKYISTARVHARNDQQEPVDSEKSADLATYLEITRMGRFGLPEVEDEDRWIAKHMPFLSYKPYEKYVQLLHYGRASVLAAIHRKVVHLAPPAKDVVLAQLLGSVAAAHHGWREHIRDPVGYIHKLVQVHEQGGLVPDEWAMEFLRVWQGKEKAPPVFIDSPQLLGRGVL